MDHRSHGARGTVPSSQQRRPGGLEVSENGLTLHLSDAHAPAGRPFDLGFQIRGEHGILTDYDVLHERRLHLILVRRDVSGFQHVHPEMSAGSWRAWRCISITRAPSS
jgi:hypothetical protein